MQQGVKIKINGQMCQIFWTLSDQHFGTGCCVESKLKGVAEMEAEKPVGGCRNNLLVK